MQKIRCCRLRNENERWREKKNTKRTNERFIKISFFSMLLWVIKSLSKKIFFLHFKRNHTNNALKIVKGIQLMMCTIFILWSFTSNNNKSKKKQQKKFLLNIVLEIRAVQNESLKELEMRCWTKRKCLN